MSPERKRAIFVASADAAGGAERVLYTLAAALAQRSGWKVTLAVTGRKMNPGFFFSAERYGVEVNFGIGSGQFGSEVALIPLAFRERYDFAMSSTIRINAALSALRRAGVLRTKRLVARESTILFDRFTGLSQLAYRFAYNLYGQQDLIIAQTDYMHRRLLEELPTRLHGKLKTLPNPTNAERIRQLALEPMELNFSKQEQSAITLVWCGRLIPVKQPVLAVDALAAARERGLSVRMVMIGDGPLRQEILTRVHQLNMSDHILLTGNQENPYPFMRSAQLGLLTSKFEGFPNVLLEMMACGVSGIVATECTGSLGMSALPRVRVVDVHSAAALASAVAAHAKDMMQSSPEAYEEELAKRSPDAFLDSILSPS